MIGALMLYGVALGALLSAAAALLERALRLGALPARLVWIAVLAATLIVPATRIRPAAHDAPPAAVERSAAAVAPPAAPRAALRLPELSTRFDRPLGFAWLALSAAIAATMGAGLFLVTRARRGWHRARIDGRTVRVSERFGPAVVGLMRPEIVLPRWAFELSAAERALILAHEEEHRRAHDPAMLALGALAIVAAPWNPCVWWQARRLRAAVELDCDGRVLRRGAEPVDYGRLLLRIGSRARSTHALALPVPALLAERGSILERRLRMITDRPRAGGRVRAAGAAAGAAALVLLACEAPTPTVTDRAESPPNQAPFTAARPRHPEIRERDLTPAGEVLSQPLIFVDGVEAPDLLIPAPPAQRDWNRYPPRGDIRLWGLNPDSIERIEVIKGDAARRHFGERGRHGVIQIFTKKAARPARPV